MQKIITITTDFGLNDSFVGVMKGVIYSINPDVKIVDINHNIERHSIIQCAVSLKNSFEYFPLNTVHLAVVDPGVGTKRLPVIVESNGHFFVGPDNGVFSYIYEDESCRVFEITNSKYYLGEVSNSFHGRDIFSPVAANLSRIQDPSEFGKIINEYVRIDIRYPSKKNNVIRGEIIYVDGFGNMMSNIKNTDVDSADEILINDESIGVILSSYSDAGMNEIMAIHGSNGYIEIAVNRGNAASRYKELPSVKIIKKIN